MQHRRSERADLQRIGFGVVKCPQMGDQFYPTSGRSIIAGWSLTGCSRNDPNFEHTLEDPVPCRIGQRQPLSYTCRRKLGQCRASNCYDLSSMLAVKPMPRRLGAGGFMSSRIAESMDAMASSCVASFFLDAGFELIEAFGEFRVRAQELAQLHKGAHDVDAHLDGAGAVEDGGGHDGAVLGERVG
jgi:hypothetical protein